MMEEALIEVLTDHAGLQAMVGTRINWVRRPDFRHLPAVTLTVVSGERQETMGGRPDLIRSRVMADCWGRTYTEAKAVARAVTHALPAGVADTGHARLQGIFIDSERDSFEGEDPTPLFRTIIDFIVWHERATS